jgi:ABC-type multidrug transport system fused ATPase/permease subunit
MKVREAVKESLRLLSRRDRRLLAVSTGLQMSTSFLDLAGVLLLGLVASVAVTVVQSQPPPGPVTEGFARLGLDSMSDQQIVISLAIAAALVLLTKSVVSVILIRRILRFLANRQALVSARLTSELLSRPLPEIQRRSTQETSYALMAGVGQATVTLLGQTVIAVTEISLLVVLSVALFFLDPLVTLGSIVFFSVVAVILQRLLGSWASRLGREGATYDIASLNAIQEAVAAYREVTVSDRRDLYADRIQSLRWQAARVASEFGFMGQIPKYVLETALVVGGFLLTSILFVSRDAVAAVGTLALFLAAASRVMPSLLRLQGAALTIRGAAGGALPTYALAAELEHSPTDTSGRGPTLPVEIKERIAHGNPDFKADVEVMDVTVIYDGATKPALEDVSLSIAHGQAVALVGKSGAGKSTLADVILGVVSPESGEVLISGLRPQLAIESWPGGISYVPQEVVLANDSIRANVALGLPPDAIDDSLVWEALERAHFSLRVRDHIVDLDTQIGERGVRLSGGQRQRLGLARALYTKPSLLVLDEATSALDAETEHAITATIQEMRDSVTTVVVAHRLSTVRFVTQIAYLEAGRLVACGTFDEMTRDVPAFRHQASLMGLL